jgi:hypothetical protein
MTDTRLWSLHHIGPDEFHPAPDFETAWRWAEWANRTFADAADISRFTVAPWPWSAPLHKQGLQAAIDGWTLPPRSRPRTLPPFIQAPTHGDVTKICRVMTECAIHTVTLPEGSFAVIVHSLPGHDGPAVVSFLDPDEVEAHITLLRNASDDAQRLDAGRAPIHAAPSLRRH